MNIRWVVSSARLEQVQHLQTLIWLQSIPVIQSSEIKCSICTLLFSFVFVTGSRWIFTERQSYWIEQTGAVSWRDCVGVEWSLVVY